MEKLFDAKLILTNGEVVAGPVTSGNNEEYLFRNIFSGLDVYFLVKKDVNGWYKSGGPESPIPEDIINQLGEQIDNYKNKQ